MEILSHSQRTNLTRSPTAKSIDARRRSQICARSYNRRLYRASSEEATRSDEPASVLSDNSKYYDVQNAPDTSGGQIPQRHVICLRCILSYNRRSLLPCYDENEHLPDTYTCRSFVCLNRHYNACYIHTHTHTHIDPFYVLSFKEADGLRQNVGDVNSPLCERSTDNP